MFVGGTYIITSQVGGGGAGSGFNYSTPLSSVAGTITGAINSSNTTFTLATAPTKPATLLLFLNGVFQLQGTDYTISGSTISMITPPTTGDTLAAL